MKAAKYTITDEDDVDGRKRKHRSIDRGSLAGCLTVVSTEKRVKVRAVKS